jgi:hypothetical protein
MCLIMRGCCQVGFRAGGWLRCDVFKCMCILLDSVLVFDVRCYIVYIIILYYTCTYTHIIILYILYYILYSSSSVLIFLIYSFPSSVKGIHLSLITLLLFWSLLPIYKRNPISYFQSLPSKSILSSSNQYPIPNHSIRVGTYVCLFIYSDPACFIGVDGWGV